MRCKIIELKYWFSEQVFVPNKTKELESACPYYFGEETNLRDPNDNEVKRFNAYFDMKSEEIFD